MQLILLSGGSGKRLWPLSNDIRSKQFIKVFRRENGEYESMLQRIYRQIMDVDPSARVTIATGKNQVGSIRNQLGDAVSICVEPARRDTFPAIALAAAFLRDRQGIGENEPVVVCPVDPYVDTGYFHALQRLSELAAEGDTNLSLLGITPTYPSEKYGYIIPETQGTVSRVSKFKEKPDLETAKAYLNQGALWNGGVFAFRLGYLLQRAHELMGFTDCQDLYRHYEQQKRISFGYAVVEGESDIQVLRYTGAWRDVGTWNTFTEVMGEAAIGNVILDNTCENVNAINELSIPVLCMGCKNQVIVVSSDGVLVADKSRNSYMKPYTERIQQQVMFAEKSWGSYCVLDSQPHALTVLVTLNPGCRMSYHSHELRDEAWTVIAGDGTAVIDGVEQPIKPGDVMKLPRGCRHTVIAGESGLRLMEVQVGKEICVEDKKTSCLKYN